MSASSFGRRRGLGADRESPERGSAGERRVYVSIHIVVDAEADVAGGGGGCGHVRAAAENENP